jgi:hypothetical protein
MADISGFATARLEDPELRRLTEMTSVITSPDIERWAARVELEYADGALRCGETTAVRGRPGRPLSWSDLDEKFQSIVTPVLGSEAQRSLEALHDFEELGRMAQICRILQ